MKNNLGSHNSWTFAKSNWLIPPFWARCQKLDIKDQYELGVRVFDLRLRWNKKTNKWGVSHGKTFFNALYEDDLKWLDFKGDAYVRVMLEYNSKPKCSEEIEQGFIEKCRSLEFAYPNIRFWGGNVKYDFHRIAYRFNNESPLVLDKYSSVTSLFKSNNKFLKIIDDWCPWFYARLENKKEYEEFVKNDNDGYLFVDFIEYTRL